MVKRTLVAIRVMIWPWQRFALFSERGLVVACQDLS